MSNSWGLTLGERPLPSADELRFIDKAANSPPSSFSYGQHFDVWDGEVSLRGQEGYVYGTIGASRVNSFYTEAIKLATELGSPVWYDRTVTAATAILDVANSPEDAEALALQVPFDEWDGGDEALPLFAGWLRQMVDAYDEPDGEQAHLIRDDSYDINADQFGKHATKIWLGSGRIRGLFILEESTIRSDEFGNRRLMREIWVMKRQTPEEALRLANRHTVIEKERMSRKLDGCSPPATAEEKEWILWHADRSTVRSDNDASNWLERLRAPYQPNRWQLLRWSALGVLAGLASLVWPGKRLAADEEQDAA